jgi:hypothetical protein
VTHTPGPWTWDRDETAMQEFRGYSISVPANDGSRVVLIPPECIEDEADARLIAAAPDLLAVLEDLMTYDETTAKSEEARAALAKAKGE